MARRGAGLFLVGAGWRHARASAEFDGDDIRTWTLETLFFMCVRCKTLVCTHVEGFQKWRFRQRWKDAIK